MADDTNRKELSEFREKWKREVSERTSPPKNQSSSVSSSSMSLLSQSMTEKLVLHDNLENKVPSNNVSATGHHDHHPRQPNQDSDTEEKSYEMRVADYLLDKSDQEKAVYYFKEASQFERKGRLNEAMSFYRKSYKLEPLVEKFLNTFSHIKLLHSEDSLGSVSGPTTSGERNQQDDFKIRYEDHGMHPEISVNVPEKFSDLSASFIASSGGRITLEPEKPQSRTHISALSTDILLHVLKILGIGNVRSVESFSGSCKLFYLLARDNHLWGSICKFTFHSASVKTSGPVWKRSMDQLRRFEPIDLNQVLETMYQGSFRLMYLYRPHVRFDGLYISIVNYVRQGFAENSMYHPVHMVTYYRYLRFFGNGIVYSLLTSEEPEIIVKKLKNLHCDPFTHPHTLKNLLIGQYLLDGLSNVLVAVNDTGIIDLDNSLDPPSTVKRTVLPRSGSSRSLKSRSESPVSPKMTYIMRFKMDATRPMAHNKLVWEEYFGKQFRNNIDETFHYPQNMLRSFIFSRVRSY